MRRHPGATSWSGRAGAVALALPLLLVLAGPARARSVEEVFGDAVDSYGRALETRERDPRLEAFRRAQLLFESLAARGVHTADLYTNLGNAALQAEDLGGAILAYRRALLLDADHARALQNLEHARGLLPAWVPRPEPAGLLDSLLVWHRAIPPETRRLLAGACFAAASLLLAGSLRFDVVALRTAAIVPGLAWLAVVGATWLDPGEAPGAAVVTGAETIARAADSSLAPSAFPQPLPPGAEVRVLEDRDPWLRVRLANGRDAWVKASSVTRIAIDDEPGALP